MNEAIYRIKQLPKETPLTAEHVLAILEWAEKSRQEPSKSESKLLDENELAQWIDEPVSSIQKWRVSGKGPKFIKKPKGVGYRVSDVEKWLDERTVSSTSEASMRGIGFLTTIPVFTHMVEGLPKQLSLVRSLATEQAPESFSFLEFSAKMMTAVHEPLMQSLAVTNEEASRLATKELLADFNVGYWFYTYCLNNGFCRGDKGRLLEALELLIDRGADINSTFQGAQASYTLAHVMADCHGTKFFVDFTGCHRTYEEVLIFLLDKGLDPYSKDENGTTPLDIAEEIESNTGLGTSMFRRVFKSWDLNRRLNNELPKK